MNRIDVFLLGLIFIYLSAFSSLLIQSKGLYGDNGILPSENSISKNPSLLINYIFGQTNSHAEDFNLLLILGVVLSSLAFLFDRFRTKLMYFFLWLFYFSIFQLGQTFLWFQWDILLLETGIIAILLPRHWIFGSSVDCHEYSSSSIGFWLVKWLIFRLMFASGVVKLTSECPTWWGLTALNWHYESQCIPTFLAWYAHQLPHWFQSLSVVATYLIEILVPILFFVPIRPIQLFCFGSQIHLQVLIILSGNYNFFNILTMILCISLLPRSNRLWKSKSIALKNQIFGYLEGMISVVVIGIMLYQLMHYFGVELDTNEYIIKSQIKFTKRSFDLFLEKMVPLSIYVGTVSLIFEIIRAVYVSIYISGIVAKVRHLIESVLVTVLVVGIFCASLVPYTTFEEKSHQRLPNSIRSLYQSLNPYEVVNSYGLFRRMTGVGGRPEIIIEGSNSFDGPWMEYEFLYKPGNLSRPPPFIVPHQPRLDWQMWFAALGSYQHNPWLINLLYRLLSDEKSVIDLLGHNPFPKEPPKFVRVKLYHYHYTAMGELKNSLWWKREFISEYLPAISLQNEGLMQYVRDSHIEHKSPKRNKRLGLIKSMVSVVMEHINQSQGHYFVWTIIGMNVLTKVMLSMMM